MKVYFKNINRKKLVKAIEEVTESKAKYLGLPTYGYQIKDIYVDKECTLHLNTSNKNIIEQLKEHNFIPFKIEDTDNTSEANDSTAVPHDISFTVSIPNDSISDIGMANLRQLLNNKKNLFEKALGTTNLEIVQDDEKVSFPWFILEQPSDAKHYMTFIEKLVNLTNNLQRINKSDYTNPPNEKYSFRCFLLRLGFIGKEYKDLRKLLLKNLSGSAAFKYTKETNKDAI